MGFSSFCPSRWYHIPFINLFPSQPSTGAFFASYWLKCTMTSPKLATHTQSLAHGLSGPSSFIWLKFFLFWFPQVPDLFALCFLFLMYASFINTGSHIIYYRNTSKWLSRTVVTNWEVSTHLRHWRSGGMDDPVAFHRLSLVTPIHSGKKKS